MRGATTGLRREVGAIRNTFLLIAFALAGVVRSFKEFFNVMVKTEASMNSLRSVASNTGLEFEKLKTFSEDLENRGIMSISGSTAALKNLAASKAAITDVAAVMSALTNAAAFNRQGTLSWEEAVVGATQGIKNQNSIMVDNAGITKNVSIMYREYATTVGKTADTLTEAEKRQAIINGVIREAGIFAGDAERAMNTYQGRISKLGVGLLKIQRGLGALIAPGVLLIFEKLSNFLNESKNLSAVNIFSSSVINMAARLVSLLIDVVDKLRATIGFLFSITDSIAGPFSGIAKTIGSIVIKMGLFTALALKVRGYMVGIGSSLVAGSVSKIIEMNEASLLKTAAASKLRIKTINTGRKASSQLMSDELNITNLINANEEKKAIFIQNNINNRLRELAIMGKQNKSAVLEAQIIQTQARRLGFDVVGSNLPGSSSKRIITPGGKSVQGFSNKPNQGNYAFLTPDMTKGLGVYDKLINSARQYRSITVMGLRQMKLGFIQVAGSMGTAKNASNNLSLGLKTLRTGLLSVVSAGKTLALSLVSGFLKIFSTYMIILTVWQTIKGFIDDAKIKNEAFSKARKNIEIEKRSILELNKVITENYDNYRIISKKGLNLLTSSGQSLNIVNTKLIESQSKLNNALSKYKTMINQTKVSEEELYDQENRIKDLRGEISKLLNLSSKTLGKYNENISNTIEIFKKSTISSGGGLSGLFQSGFDLDKSLIENRGKLVARLGIKVNAEIGRSLRLREFQYNAFHVINRLSEIKHQQTIQQIIMRGERKIADIRRKTNLEILKGRRDSFILEMAQLKAQGESRISQIEQNISQLNFERSKTKIGVLIQNLYSDLKKEQLTDTIDSYKKSIDNVIKRISAYTVKKISDFYTGVLQKAGKKSFDAEFVVKMRLEGVKIKVGKDEIPTLERIIQLNKQRGDVLSKIRSSRLLFDKKLRGKTDEFSQRSLKESSIRLAKQLKLLDDIKTGYLQVKNVIESTLRIPKVIKTGFVAELQSMIIGIDNLVSTISQGKNDILAFNNSLKSLSRSEEIQKNTQKNINLLTKQSNILKSSLNKEKLEIIKGIERTATEALRKATNMVKVNTELASVTNILSKGNFAYNSSIQSINDSMAQMDVSSKIILKDLKISKKDLEGMGLAGKLAAENLIKVFRDFFEKLKINKKLITLKNALKSIARETRILNRESSFFDIASKEKFNPEGITLFIKEITRLDNALRRIDFASEAGLNSSEILKYIDNLRANYVKSLDDMILKTKESNRSIQENLRIFKGENTTNIFDLILGIPRGQINSIQNTYIKAISNIDDRIKTLKSSKSRIEDKMFKSGFGTEKYSGYNQILNSIDKQINELDIQASNKVTQMAIGRANVFKRVYSGLISGAFSAAQQFAEFLRGDLSKVEQEREQLLKDQDNAFKRGELSTFQHGQNIAKINQYFADKVNKSWIKVAGSVAQKVLEMTADVMKSLAAAEAARASAAAGGNFLTGLEAALPGLGIALGLGFASGLIGGSNDNTQKALDLSSGVQSNASTKFGGTIKAEDVQITISPSFIIEGNQIFIGSGSIVEFVDESTALMKESIQTAIDNREFNLDGVIQKA